ncbi:head-tail connector protein [Lysobacter fragariae]
MGLRLITPAGLKPVTISEARDHVEVFGSAHDAKLTAMIDAAVSNLDGRDGILGRALIEQEWELTLDAFPACSICPPLPPLLSITSVKYIDTNGVEQTLASGAYKVEPGEHGRVSPVFGTSWPATRSESGAVKVQFKAGYGANDSAVPQAIRSAILLIVGDLFENREGQGDQLFENATVDRLLFPFRIVRP